MAAPGIVAESVTVGAWEIVAAPGIVAGRATAEQVGIAEVTAQARGPVIGARIAEEGVAIASATKAYHPGLAGLRKATPLAGAVPVAVRRAPAARAEPLAWVLVVAVAAAAAVAGGGRKAMNWEIQMKLSTVTWFGRKALSGLLLLAFCCLIGLFLSLPSMPQEKASTTPQPDQKTFTTPQEAADAFIKAIDPFDTSALQQILGPHGEDLVASEDPVQDKNIAAEFAAKARQKNSVTIDPKNPNRAILVVGNTDFPMAIPIVKRNGVCLFDTKAGRQEMLYRRIGSNELDAIAICRGYVEAQHEYALEKHDGSEVNQYAQRVISTPGKHDGLVWRNPDGTLGGPIAENIADALQEGYTDKSKPYHGYFFKILKGQGPAAPLGQMDFVVEGAMIGGFALAAAPAQYRVTGVKTFIVGYRGVVYQKDLGPDTLKIFQTMELYNPDKTWQPTDDSWPWDSTTAASNP